MTIAGRKAIRRIVKNNKGAAAIEFAIVSAPLIALILASLQTAIIFFYDSALQTATERAARQLMTGNAQSQNMTQSQFKSLVCGYANAFNCNGLMVDVQSASSFSALNTTSLTPTYSNGTVTNNWAYNPGNAGDIVIIRVMYDWPVFGGPLSLNLANQANGTYLLVGTSVFKNEPYQ